VIITCSLWQILKLLHYSRVLPWHLLFLTIWASLHTSNLVQQIYRSRTSENIFAPFSESENSWASPEFIFSAFVRETHWNFLHSCASWHLLWIWCCCSLLYSCYFCYRSPVTTCLWWIYMISNLQQSYNILHFVNTMLHSVFLVIVNQVELSSLFLSIFFLPRSSCFLLFLPSPHLTKIRNYFSVYVRFSTPPIRVHRKIRSNFVVSS